MEYNNKRNNYKENNFMYILEGGLGGGILGMLPLMVIMFLIMYFIIIRPQKKQQKQFDEMISNLKKGEQAVAVLYTYENTINKILK